MAEHLIESYGSLFDESGRLREPGYALRPPFAYDRHEVAAPAVRIKEWDYYLVNDDEHAVALTVSDLGYIGLISASVMDFATSTFRTESELVMMPMGRMGLPAASDSGDVVWVGKRTKAVFAHTPAGRRLSFEMEGFGGEELEVEVLLDEEPRDSMVIVTPWAEDEQAFYYNRKIVGMRARGGFRRGAYVHEFDPSDSLGILDWGRGVWTYDNTWYWAVAQGRQDGRLIGLNLGYGFGDTSAASENMLFVDGICHKLGRCDFGIPRHFDGSYRYMEAWHMSEEDGRLELTFSPEIDRVDDINVLGIVQSNQHQVFGKLDGFVVLDDGTRLEIKGLRGSAEHIHNRY